MRAKDVKTIPALTARIPEYNWAPQIPVHQDRKKLIESQFN